jgi:hypothetical protein
LSISARRQAGTARSMSEQTPQPSDPDREHSGGDPAHDPTQDGPTEQETVREPIEGDDEDDSDDD